MSMIVGIPKETASGEARVAATPDTVKRIKGKGLDVVVESGAGEASSFTDEDYREAGAEAGDSARALGADIVFKVVGPTEAEIATMKRGAVLASFIDVCGDDAQLRALAGAGVDAVAMELIPRISRAQNMDALSSQAGVAGYRAVIEAGHLYGRFFPLMMTAAGSSKPARVVVLGAGVAGLQAIATAKRLGARIFAYDVRPQVKEEIESLGAKFIDLDVGESGEGTGGYAKELSAEAQARQKQQLTEELMKADIIVSTAAIPCRPAPVLITAEAVAGMRAGSVIIDLAAATGGNCELTEPGQVVSHNGVTICGLTNFPSLMASDASAFYARNLLNLLPLLIDADDGGVKKKENLLEDEITAAALVTHDGEVRYQRPGS